MSEVERFVQDLERATRAGNAAVATHVAGAVIQEHEHGAMLAGGDGRASRPGNPPAIQTSRLRSAIAAESLPDGSAVVGVVQDTYPGGNTVAEVATTLEYGDGRVAARPMWAPALERVAGELPGIWEATVNEHLAGGRS